MSIAKSGSVLFVAAVATSAVINVVAPVDKSMQLNASQQPPVAMNFEGTAAPSEAPSTPSASASPTPPARPPCR